MQTMLITGGAGFIGTNFVHHLRKTRPDLSLIVLDALTYAGNLENLAGIESDAHFTFVRGNVCDDALVASLFASRSIDYVVNFAAESHVDRSIDAPGVFIQTNVLGTQTLLDAAKAHWKLKPEDKYDRSYRQGVCFLQVSTDEVYGSLGPTGLFREDTPLSPNSPYAASKASADLLALAYWETYGLPVRITRCSNNYGAYQFPEKLIPLMIHNAMRNEPLPVYGDGLQVRDWLHVEDHCRAIETVLERGAPGTVYNVGGNNERTNLEIVRLILEALDRPASLIRHVQDRLGHDRRYAIDSTRLTTQLGWMPVHAFEEGIAETIAWYQTHQDWLQGVTSGAYQTYYDRMYAGRPDA